MTFLKVHRTTNYLRVNHTRSHTTASRRRTTLLRFCPTAPWTSRGSSPRSLEAVDQPREQPQSHHHYIQLKPPRWPGTESSLTTRTMRAAVAVSTIVGARPVLMPGLVPCRDTTTGSHRPHHRSRRARSSQNADLCQGNLFCFMTWTIKCKCPFTEENVTVFKTARAPRVIPVKWAGEASSSCTPLPVSYLIISL